MYKALIIDDEKPVQIAVCKLGRWHSYNIETPAIASNGKEGLYAMRELHPDIVFVDMQMPVINGIEFLKSACKEFPNSKYIIISGFDDFYYAQNAIRSGAIDYLLKPIDEDDLNASIEKAILQINPKADFSALNQEDADISPDEIVATIREYIDKNYSQNLNISMFSNKYYFSKEYLSKVFKAKYDFGIYEYVLKVRMERARELLSDENMKVQLISDRLGYTDSNYFSKAFRNYYGITPSQFRKNLTEIS